jgi:hypothetical protein
MLANGQNINNFFQQYATKHLPFSSHTDFWITNILDVQKNHPENSFMINSKNRFEP